LVIALVRREGFESLRRARLLRFRAVLAVARLAAALLLCFAIILPL
jgi:hypothetical protein